jgi:hypothetical protein
MLFPSIPWWIMPACLNHLQLPAFVRTEWLDKLNIEKYTWAGKTALQRSIHGTFCGFLQCSCNIVKRNKQVHFVRIELWIHSYLVYVTARFDLFQAPALGYWKSCTNIFRRLKMPWGPTLHKTFAQCFDSVLPVPQNGIDFNPLPTSQIFNVAYSEFANNQQCTVMVVCDVTDDYKTNDISFKRAVQIRPLRP